MDVSLVLWGVMLLPLAAWGLLACRQTVVAWGVMAAHGIWLVSAALSVSAGDSIGWVWAPAKSVSLAWGVLPRSLPFLVVAHVLVWVGVALARGDRLMRLRTVGIWAVVNLLLMSLGFLAWGMAEGVLLLLLLADTTSPPGQDRHPFKAVMVLACGLWLVMCAGFLVQALDDRHVTDWLVLSGSTALTEVNAWLKLLVFACMAVGMAIKLPVVPWYRWLNDVLSPASWLWVAWLPLVGAYGLLVTVSGLFPDVAEQTGAVFAVCALLTAVMAVLSGVGGQGPTERVVSLAMGQASVLLLALALPQAAVLVPLWAVSYGLGMGLLLLAQQVGARRGMQVAALSLMGLPPLGGMVVLASVMGVAVTRYPLAAGIVLMGGWWVAARWLTVVPDAEPRPASKWLLLALGLLLALTGLAAGPLVAFLQGGGS